MAHTATEATLFFARPPGLELAAMSGQIERSCRRLVPAFRQRPAGLDDLAFAGAGTSLVVAMSGPLQVRRFAEARRPTEATMRPADVAVRLHSHRTTLAISVTGGTHESELGLCYIAAAVLLSSTDPELVHWGPSDRLYALGEFLTAAGAEGGMPVRRATPRRARPRSRPTALDRLPHLAPPVPAAAPAPPHPHRADRFHRLMARGLGVGTTSALSCTLLLDAFVAGFAIG